MSRYATDDRLPIDNNPVENTIRPIALGKKNCLFTGSERAAKRAAAIQTLLGTAKLNGLDPAAWLRDTLEKLPTCLNSRIDSLLPLRSEPLHQTLSQANVAGLDACSKSSCIGPEIVLSDIYSIGQHVQTRSVYEGQLPHFGYGGTE